MDSTVDQLLTLGEYSAADRLLSQKARDKENSGSQDNVPVPHVIGPTEPVVPPEQLENHTPSLVPADAPALYSNSKLGGGEEAHDGAVQVHVITGKPGNTKTYLAEIRILKELGAVEAKQPMKTYREVDGTEE